MQTDDTIVAISSAVGPAARMIVRLSGPQAVSIASGFVRGQMPPVARPARCTVQLDRFEFPAWVYRFASPRSATGDDVVEFHIPGNPVLARMLLGRLLVLGARPAQPGEFTARAYFNGRIDLAQAEGIAAIIGAQNEAELRAARQLLAGELARRLSPAMDLLAQTLALVEVGIDFSDEDVTFLSPAQAARRLVQLRSMLQQLLAGSARFERLAHEPLVVLFGRPNAGKSTLLNALSRQERAVVSPVAGTTRDALSVHVALAHGVIELVDVAGVDDAQNEAEVETPQLQIERQMRRRALRSLESADLVLLVREATDARPPPPMTRPPDMVVLSKSDLLQDAPRPAAPSQLLVSVATGQGLGELSARLDELAFAAAERAPMLALNIRHHSAITAALEALSGAEQALEAGTEILALELREALDQLGSILGSVSPDDVLGRIFSTFCIGK